MSGGRVSGDLRVGGNVLLDGRPLEAEYLLELNAVAEVAIWEMAFMDDSADALHIGTRASRKIGGHTKSHGKRGAHYERHWTAHE